METQEEAGRSRREEEEDPAAISDERCCLHGECRGIKRI